MQKGAIPDATQKLAGLHTLHVARTPEIIRTSQGTKRRQLCPRRMRCRTGSKLDINSCDFDDEMLEPLFRSRSWFDNGEEDIGDKSNPNWSSLNLEVYGGDRPKLQ